MSTTHQEPGIELTEAEKRAVIEDLRRTKANPTDDEIKNSLSAALRAKEGKVNLVKYSSELKEEKVFFKPDAKQYWSYLLVRYNTKEKPLIADKWVKQKMMQLCLYFTNDPEAKIPAHKGFVLQGNTGVGKTHLAKMFASNPKGSYRVVSCRDIANEYAKDGVDVIREYSRLSSNVIIGRDFGNGSELGICFDDLGAEDDMKNFGNLKNVMADLICACYDNYQLKGRVHFTTNLSMTSIKETYGERAYSRLLEMTHPIRFDMDAPDRRKSI